MTRKDMLARMKELEDEARKSVSNAHTDKHQWYAEGRRSAFATLVSMLECAEWMEDRKDGN